MFPLLNGFAATPPFDAPCVGQKATYAISADGATLTGVNPPSCTFKGFIAL